MRSLYDTLHETLKSRGGTHIGGGFTAEYMLLAFFPLAFVALLHGLDSLTAAVLAILVTALVAFSLPLVKKVSRENSDHFAIAAFYIAIVMGLVLFLMVGGF